jgi:lycopene cyclase domain-containing protein
VLQDRYVYLALDLFSFFFPFIFSFYSKAPFYKQWRYAIPSILLVAIAFIVWDESFTQMGVWGFNPRYLTGVYVANLPVEELLFFFCVPYACVFTYFAINHLATQDYLKPYERYTTIVLIVFLIVTGLVFISRLYTSVTFISLAIFLGLLYRTARPNYLSRFYFAYLFILIPFFLINGVLTGSWIDEEVVWYNNAENLNIRLGTVPFEDLFYNMLMLLMSVSMFEYLRARKVKPAIQQ